MCTIALAWQVLADAPVAIAANRDEALDRESEPPQVLDRDPAVVAPRDADAGGTWIGVSERGLVAALTNRWIEPPEEASREGTSTDGDDRRSRGLLVRDALAADDATEAVDLVRRAVEADRYAGFNLLLADAERATYLEWDGETEREDPDADDPDLDGDPGLDDASLDHSPAAPELRERELEPGVHAVVNPGLDEVDDRALRLRDDLAIQGTAPGAAAWLDAAATRLRDHEFGVCVHGDGFGTRSSSLLRVGADRRSAYAFADGAPCTTDYQHVDLPAAFVEESF